MPDLAHPDFMPRMHHRLLPDGTVTSGTTPIVLVVPTAGVRFFTIRGLVTTQNSVITLAYLRPDGTAYAVSPPTGVTLTAATENATAEITNGGQAWLRVTITPVSGSVISYLDFYGI